MARSGSHPVAVDVDGELIVLSPRERDALLDRLSIISRPLPTGETTIGRKFNEAAAAGKPVEFDPAERDRLRVMLAVWAAVSLEGLPAGIARLRAALAAALVRADD